ncbi:MAG: T9SS type A sorting domain-containing protein [candidate division WOR-3 bacterium]
MRSLLKLRVGVIYLFLFIFSKNLNGQNAVVINLDSTHQIIRGFGAANILPWRPDMTPSEIETAFGTGDGQLGFSILRIRIPYRESEFNLNVPTAKLAHSFGVNIIASPWTPPPEFKTNKSPVGGELLEDYYDDFAAHLDSFATYMAANEAPIYAISVQNEPDINVPYESCSWNASQMVKFIKENASSIGVKVMAPESYHFNKAFSDPILNDPDACANLDIVAGHIYGGGLEPYPLAEQKGKEVWMTEHLDTIFTWKAALLTGKEIHDCLVSGMSAYLWWYIVRFYGPISDGERNSGNKGEVTKRGFVMSQFSRFIRPGYLRIKCNDNPQNGIYVSAYKDSTSSTIVIVAINLSIYTKNLTFVFKNGAVKAFIPYVTSKTENCSPKNHIVVKNDSLNITLPEGSITTFVSSDSGIEEIVTTPSFKLFQNCPNPFSHLTEIKFEIPKSSFVSLKVYNLLGEEVAVIAEREFESGIHSVNFDASSLTNGLYFYTLKAGDLIDSKKLCIIK